ncbi:MAG: hypothetical protein C4329_02585 [Chitinophagaceae bacterium]
MKQGLVSMAIVLCCWLTLPAAAQARHDFSAKQAADYAKKNSVQVKNALLDIQIQQQTNKEITASALPSITGNAGLNYFPNVGVQTFPNFIAAGTYGVLAANGVRWKWQSYCCT